MLDARRLHVRATQGLRVEFQVQDHVLGTIRFLSGDCVLAIDSGSVAGGWSGQRSMHGVRAVQRRSVLRTHKTETLTMRRDLTTFIKAKYIEEALEKAESRRHANQSLGDKQCRALSLAEGANCCALVAGHPGAHENHFGTEFTEFVTRVSDLPPKTRHWKNRCPKHKRYAAKGKPKTPCEPCWRLYILKHPV